MGSAGSWAWGSPTAPEDSGLELGVLPTLLCSKPLSGATLKEWKWLNSCTRFSFAAPWRIWDWLEWLKCSWFVSRRPHNHFPSLAELALGFVGSAAQSYRPCWFFVLGSFVGFFLLFVCFLGCFFFFNFLSLFKQDLEFWTNLLQLKHVAYLPWNCFFTYAFVLGMSVLCCNSLLCGILVLLTDNWCSSHPGDFPKLNSGSGLDSECGLGGLGLVFFFNFLSPISHSWRESPTGLTLGGAKMEAPESAL